MTTRFWHQSATWASLAPRTATIVPLKLQWHTCTHARTRNATCLLEAVEKRPPPVSVVDGAHLNDLFFAAWNRACIRGDDRSKSIPVAPLPCEAVGATRRARHHPEHCASSLTNGSQVSAGTVFVRVASPPFQPTSVYKQRHIDLLLPHLREQRSCHEPEGLLVRQQKQQRSSANIEATLTASPSYSFSAVITTTTTTTTTTTCRQQQLQRWRRRLQQAAASAVSA